VGAPVGRPLPRLSTVREVRGLIPMDSTKFFKLYHGATWHHTICPKRCHTTQFVSVSNDSSISLPLNCQLSTDTSPATCGSVPCQVSCTDCTVNKCFLFVWQNEQNMISHSFDVRLNPFELRWVREDEAYAPICFEAIPSTLIFGLNFDPWSRF
jgi:hypothetical protein